MSQFSSGGQRIGVFSFSISPSNEFSRLISFRMDWLDLLAVQGTHKSFLQYMKVKSESEVAQSCPTLRNPMNCSSPGSSIHGISQARVLEWVAIAFSTFPMSQFFSNESVLHIRWPKYWHFSFSFSPSNEYSGLISFMIDWFDLLAVQGTLRSLLQHHRSKASILRHSAL